MRFWSRKPDRKPLLLRGARQVGKSHLASVFAESHYLADQIHRFDFRSQKELQSVFADAGNFDQLIVQLEIASGKKIDTESDILILDELQEAPGGVPALKDFYEKCPRLAVIAAGSHLGLTLNEDPFPVGCVQQVTLSPMTFQEFLQAIDMSLFEVFEKTAIDAKPLPQLIHKRLMSRFQQYMAVGGMPEAVAAYVSGSAKEVHATLQQVRQIQKDLLMGYQSDFVKYAGRVNATHILAVFNSIGQQLQKAIDSEVKRYKFSGVIPNQSGYSRLLGPLQWLITARLCIRCPIASDAQIPMKASTQENKFKLYHFDVGILQAALEIPIHSIVSEELGSYKGFLAENFVAQEVAAKSDSELVSWQKNTAEIEFVLQTETGELVPIEVKASRRSRQAKSLDSYYDRYKPARGFKLSGQNFGAHPSKTGLLTVPIYMIGKLC